MISPAQARGARAMLRWTAAELAQRAHLSVNTVIRVEAERPVNTSTLALMAAAMEREGVVFVGTAGIELTARFRERD